MLYSADIDAGTLLFVNNDQGPMFQVSKSPTARRGDLLYGPEHTVLNQAGRYYVVRDPCEATFVKGKNWVSSKRNSVDVCDKVRKRGASDPVRP
jgi:hypothetical protein